MVTMTKSSLLVSVLTSVLLTFIFVGSALSLTSSGPIVINGKSGTVISGLKITSTTGTCVQIIDSTNITIEKSEIGPCGKNGTTDDSNGILVDGGSSINIYDNYIHIDTLAPGCCDSHDAILTVNTSNITIQGNVIAFGETNIEAQTGTNGIYVSREPRRCIQFLAKQYLFGE
jgi:hypothetical protein